VRHLVGACCVAVCASCAGGFSSVLRVRVGSGRSHLILWGSSPTMFRPYCLYSARPVPESHVALPMLFAAGSRAPRRQELMDLTRDTESLERTKPHTSEYGLFHFSDSLAASRLLAAFASDPRTPSTEKTRGVKCRRCSRQAFRYFFFFSFSCFSRTFAVDCPR
jgi:hypothetical protein